MIFDTRTDPRFKQEIKLSRQEVGALRGAWRQFSSAVPEGAGDESVIVIPCYNGDDGTTKILRDKLTKKNHSALESGLTDMKLDFKPEVFAVLENTLRDTAERTGEKVALIGNSAGGVFARELGMRFPDRVSRVITLASDFKLEAGKMFVGVSAQDVLKQASGRLSQEFANSVTYNRKAPPRVPTTSIFTREDLLVPDAESINDPSWALAQDVFATTSNVTLLDPQTIRPPSHMGLAFNMQVLTCICDRLVASLEDWKRFDPSRYEVFSRFP